MGCVCEPYGLRYQFSRRGTAKSSLLLRVQPNRDVLWLGRQSSSGNPAVREAPWLNKGFLTLSHGFGPTVQHSCYLIAMLTPPIRAFIGSWAL
jgi:hypothetical protein